jgi:hypothetical protein
VTEEDADKVLAEHSGELMSIPGVIGAGRGLCGGNPCIKVFVVKKTQKLLEELPKAIEGVPVDAVETGEIKPLDK